jgi:hypothetical protein
MESIEFDWLNVDWASNHDPFHSDSPRVGTAAEQASQVAGRIDQPSIEHALPLLRLSGWESDKQYDKTNPVCIHYDFRWKTSQRENIRARHICSDTDPDLVLAPSDVWKVTFQARLECLIQDENKFPGDIYTCEETTVEISIELSRQRGLTKRYPKLEINWKEVDDHLEGLGDLFSKGRKIVFSIEFV